VFEEFERSDKVKAVLDSNLKFFDWYSQVRNSILHAQHYPAALSADDDTLYLVKRRNKKTNASGYLRFTLPQLRAFADRFKEGSRHCAHFFIYLRHRNVPEAKWPPIIRQYGR